MSLSQAKAASSHAKAFTGAKSFWLPNQWERRCSMAATCKVPANSLKSDERSKHLGAGMTPRQWGELQALLMWARAHCWCLVAAPVVEPRAAALPGAAYITSSSGKKPVDRPLQAKFILWVIPTSANTEKFMQTVCIVHLIYYIYAMCSQLLQADLARLALAHRYGIIVVMIYLHRRETSCIVAILFQLAKKTQTKQQDQPYVSLDLVYGTFYSLIW